MGCFHVYLWQAGPRTPDYNIEGSWPEWCISTVYHAWDTPFGLWTLDIETGDGEHSDKYDDDSGGKDVMMMSVK